VTTKTRNNLVIAGHVIKLDFEIGRILHLKSEIRNIRLDGSNLHFRISDLRCRIRPISKFRFHFGPNRVSQWPSGSLKVQAQEPGVTSRGSLTNLHPFSINCRWPAVTLSAATTISIAPARGPSGRLRPEFSISMTGPAEKNAKDSNWFCRSKPALSR